MKIVSCLRRKVSIYLDRGFCIFLWVYENAMYRIQRFVMPLACEPGKASPLIDFFHTEPNLISSIPPIDLVI
jgi:hypothetical protein